jgi:hypothetical protein
MSADRNSLHTVTATAANLEGPQEKLVAEDSPIDLPHG